MMVMWLALTVMARLMVMMMVRMTAGLALMVMVRPRQANEAA